MEEESLLVDTNAYAPDQQVRSLIVGFHDLSCCILSFLAVQFAEINVPRVWALCSVVELRAKRDV